MSTKACLRMSAWHTERLPNDVNASSKSNDAEKNVAERVEERSEPDSSSLEANQDSRDPSDGSVYNTGESTTVGSTASELLEENKSV
jgi:hypothetical protein